MRFCPFCAQDNPDDARECGHCGKRLPPPRTAPPRAAPAPPVAERPKKEIPARPAPRSKPLVGKEPLPDRPSESPAEVEARDAFDPSVPTAVSGPPLGAKPSGPMSSANSEMPTMPNNPLEEIQDEKTAPHVPPPPPTGPAQPKKNAESATLLGITSPEHSRPGTKLPGAQPVAPFPDEQDSARRSTRPLTVDAAAQAAGQSPAPQKTTAARGVSPLAPTVAVPTKPPAPKPPKPGAFDEDKSTVVDSRAPKAAGAEESLGADTVDNEPLAPLGGGHTPVLPTLALPPMPPKPGSPKILEAVMYLPPLAKAIWARKKAQDHIRSLLHGDQRILDQVLRDLGRAAREAQLDVPAVAEEMRRVKAEEDRRNKAERDLKTLEDDREKELQRWGAEEAERNQDLGQRDGEIHAAEEELKKKGDERRTHDAERAKIDAQIRGFEKKAAAEDTRAARAENMPPEKGGGPNTVANAEAAAEQARKEATALIPARDVAKARVEALDGPIAVLTKQVVDGRALQAQKKKELTDAQASHKRTLTQFDADKRRCEAERDGAEREMSQRFVAAGTLLNLNRVEGERFQPIYARIDELKAGVNAREAAIVRLESERRSYDRPAVQKGLVTIGVAVGVLILLLIILVVVLGRH
jgi:hypothetical protein